MYLGLGMSGHWAGMIQQWLSLRDERELWLLALGAKHVSAIVPLARWYSHMGYRGQGTVLASSLRGTQWCRLQIAPSAGLRPCEDCRGEVCRCTRY